MAVKLKNSIFIHVPKAGGTWVTRVLGVMGLITERYPLSAHCSLRDVVSRYKEDEGLKSFCFVRHPLGWYQSFWAFRQSRGWDPTNALDGCRASTFEGFIENVLEQQPGYLSGRLQELTQGVTYVGRFEAIRESLIEILSNLGESFSSAAVYDHPPVNVSQESTGSTGRYTPDLIRRLSESESWAFQTFGYATRSLPSR
jgi:hypothetical protein